MKKGDKKKQQKAIKRRSENKQVRKQIMGQGGNSPKRHLRQARQYPIAECWIQRNWEASGLAVVAVVRQQPNGLLVFGNYLVDTYCLGVKNTLWEADVSPVEFQRDWLPQMYEASGKPIKISADLAHEIVYGSIDYARQFGFKPHRDFAETQLILDPANAHPLTGKVTFGQDGKPMFVAGPYDNADAIMRQLARTAGEGNYHYFMPLGDPFDEEDEWDEDLPESIGPANVIEGLDYDIGDSVVVKAGVKDPDMDCDIGGWQGRVTDIDEDGDDESVIVTIEWDSQTLNTMPGWIVERCDQEDLNWEVMNLGLEDIERTKPRDTLADVSAARAKLVQQYGEPFGKPSELDEQGVQDARIATVLAGIDAADVMAALGAWEDSLGQRLSFPFEAQVAEFQERGPLQAGDVVEVRSLRDSDDLYGILVTVKSKRGQHAFPLCDLDATDQASPNYQALDDYATWFANR